MFSIMHMQDVQYCVGHSHADFQGMESFYLCSAFSCLIVCKDHLCLCLSISPLYLIAVSLHAQMVESSYQDLWTR